MNLPVPSLRLALALGLAVVGCSASWARQAETWQNPDVSIDERVTDLLDRLTISEKISLLHFENPAVDHLGIPAYNWWNEALHGVARHGRATVFPQAINLAATWDETLVHTVAEAISDEARAKFNVAQRLGNRGQYAGLTYWSPNINLFRDLRWGRGHETYGEDPFLTSRIGIAFVRGMQGDHPRYLKTAACAKHFVVHSGPEAVRHEFDARASQKDMRETYFPAFEALVREGGVEGVMCSYNRLNGVPVCASADLLRTLLRDEWGFKGYVVSDCGALSNIVNTHRFVDTPEQAAALALKAGVNINCGGLWAGYLKKAFDLGLVSEADLDRALGEALPTRFRLGLFDPTDRDPWRNLPEAVVGSAEHARLAREAAVKSIVMLKNNGVLPLKRDLPSLAVIGPTAASVEVLLGNYYGLNDGMSTFLEGVAAAVSAGTTIEHHIGVDVDRGEVRRGSWPVSRSQSTEAIVAFVGMSPLLEGEGGESVFINEASAIELPPHQVGMIRALRDGYDKPLVVVVTGGSPRAIAEIHDLADAVLWAGYPGQEGGHALADILFGAVNPSGRLPVTVPFSTADVPAYDDYGMAGRTYRYQAVDPLYPFGFGLSYARFEYGELRVTPEVISPGDSATVRLTVTNTGPRAGEEVVQLYVTDDEAAVRVPRAGLAAFRRVVLVPGESTTVSFRVSPDRFQVVGDDGSAFFEAGTFTLSAGAASPGPRAAALGAPPAATATIRLR